MYWAGLAVAAQGIAGNDVNAFLWGIETYRRGVDAIQPDGSLTAEMNRAAMAVHYQLYALGPLVMLAELAAANGLDLYRGGQRRHSQARQLRHRRHERPVHHRSPYRGRAKYLRDLFRKLEIGWAVPYVQRFPDPQLSAWIAKAPWVRFWQWGGAPPNAVIPIPPRSAALPSFPGHSFTGTWCGQGDPRIPRPSPTAPPFSR